MTDGNFHRLIADRIDRERATTFLSIPNGRDWSFGAIDDLSARLAAVLAANGAKPGDRIAVQVEKSAENVALYLASLRGGFVYAPLNIAYTDEEIAYFIGDAEPAVLVCDPTRAPERAAPAVLTLTADGKGSLIDGARSAAPSSTASRGADDLASILYTSGTTGRPKGAMLTHGNLSSNAIALKELWAFGADDALLHALPIFHIHGLFVALNVALLSACKVLFLPRFDVATVRERLSEATVMMGVPTFYTRLLADKDFGKADAASMRLFVSGSAPLLKETFDAFELRTGHRILERYGMSETGMIASNPLGGERIAGTVGYAIPGVDIRITADGAPVPPGKTGDVEVRGPNVCKGYWRAPEKTAEAFHDTWFSTGDIGVLSQDGRLTLSGRAKDFIIVGGYNVYPREIETLLDALPEIAESAVIGVPHPDLGEGVVAVLVPAEGSVEKPPLSDLRMKESLSALAKFKQPRKFIWLNGLPRNAMGKVQKAELRRQLASTFRT